MPGNTSNNRGARTSYPLSFFQVPEKPANSKSKPSVLRIQNATCAKQMLDVFAAN